MINFEERVKGVFEVFNQMIIYWSVRLKNLNEE